ncbi:MAG TPA: hypothetical protein PKI32_00995 [Opitutales bacterium]|nr:hypothetical protein [Opitutales bacterium]
MKIGENIKMSVSALVAMCVVAATAGVQLDPQGTETKKYVAFGQEYSYMLPQDFLDHVDQFLETPLDGVGIHMNGGKGTPRPYQCFRNTLNLPRWTREWLRDYVEPLRKMATYRCFKESFIWSYYPPEKRLAWTDDEAWNVASNNLRCITWLAREGHLRGVSFDIEDYTKQKQLFRIPGDPPYDELVKLARKRGREIGGGIFEEFPDVTVFMFWLLSDAPYRYGERDLPALMRERGDLWPAFVNGMLDVLPPTATIVDGSEDGYKYEASRHDYHGDYARIFNWDLALVEPENRAKYLTQVSPSFGQYLDMYVNEGNTHWYAAPEDGSRLRHLARNVREATSSAKKYVWFWSEKGRWTPWSKRYWNDPERLCRNARFNWQDRIPGGFYETLKAIKDPEGYLVPQLEKAIAAGEMEDLLGRVTVKLGERFDRVFPELKKGNVYYLTGWVRAENCKSTVTYVGDDRFGLFGPRDLLTPGRPGADGWRKLVQFITVPDTAAAMSLNVTDECRDLRMYDVSGSNAWRNPAKLVKPECAFVADCSKPDGWTLDTYENRLAAEACEVEDEKALRLVRRSAPANGAKDTAWSLTTAAFDVTPGMDLEVSGRIISPAPATGGKMSARHFTGVVWIGADGKELGEPGVFGFPGREKHWRTHVRRVRVPAGAAKACLMLGFDGPGFGKDDFFACSSLRARLLEAGAKGWDDPAFETTVPGRIEMVTASPCEDAKSPIRFRIAAPRGVDWESLEVLVDGKAVEPSRIRRYGLVFTVDPEGGEWKMPSDHRIEVAGRDRDGTRFEDEQLFAIGEATREDVVTLRDDGTVLVDGRPFFPIGFYGCFDKNADGTYDYEKPLCELKAAGCNVAQIYPPACDDAGMARVEEFLSAADRLGMKAFVRPGRVRGECDFAEILRTRKRHPSVLGWFIGDDTASHQSVSQVWRNHKSVKACDNGRLTVQTDSEIFHNFGIHRYLPFAGSTDVFQPQIYPVEKAETTGKEVPEAIQMMKACAEDLAAAGKPKVSVWPVLQAFMQHGEKSGWKRYPTAAEMRAIAYETIVHGAKGLIWYTYRSMAKGIPGAAADAEYWKRVTDVTKEIASIQEYLVQPDSGMQPKAEVLEGPVKDALGFDSISLLMKSKKEDNLVIAVNSSTNAVKARIVRPGFQHVTRVFGNGERIKSNSSFIDDFAPLEVHVYRVK